MSQPTARWVISGNLRLATAARLGVGTSEAADLTVGLDEETGRPVLPGTTLAGLLRSHVVAARHGLRSPEQSGDPSERLFGILRASTGDAGQSAAIVFDAVADPSADGSNAVIEIRDGVAIDQATGTAADHKKYDYEVIPAGVTFPIRVDLVVRSGQDEAELISWLARALEGLGPGGIRLGAKTSRGLGSVTADQWRARRFDLTSPEGWMTWLATDHLDPTAGTSSNEFITEALSAAAEGRISPAGDRPLPAATFVLDLRFDEPLLIGSPGSAADDPDDVHLISAGSPILSGTSVAGVLRHRLGAIANFALDDPARAGELVDWLFGPHLDLLEVNPDGDEKRPVAQQSRLRVSESRLDGGRMERRTRVAIDRFTGGVLDGYLFEQQPIVGATTKIELDVVAAPGDPDTAAAVALMVMVCRDVIDGFVSFGGDQAIGHGFATGSAAVFLGESPHDPQPTPIDLFSPEANALVESLWSDPEVTHA